MAKQNGPFIFEMTVCGVSFYKRCGRGYVRMKSNLTAERWKKDPAFEGSRQCAANMAQSSVVAGQYYQTIPRENRCYPFYRRLVGISQEMLCAGFTMQQVEKVLDYTVCLYLRKLAANNASKKPVRSSFSAATRSFKTLQAFPSASIATASLADAPIAAAATTPAEMVTPGMTATRMAAATTPAEMVTPGMTATRMAVAMTSAGMVAPGMTATPVAATQLTGWPSHSAEIASGPVVFHPATSIPPRGRPYKTAMASLTPSLISNTAAISTVAGLPMLMPSIFLS